MNIKQILSLLVLAASVTSLPAQAHNNSYWNDSVNGKLINSQGECWRTSHWDQADVVAGCSGDMKMAEKDSDNDGIMDGMDNCPGTASGVMVDAKGCAKDSDGDGVVDSFDNCANTARGIMVDSSGCAKDSDNDGVIDNDDKCPGTAAGMAVNAKGCEVAKDSDNDGIVDANDDCAGTAAGTVVNDRGCELKADIRLHNVQFKTGTAELSVDSQNILDRVAQTLKENQHLSFEIAGHTDSTGSYEANVKLSDARANAVRNYLMDQGVASNRLTAQGYGPDKPVASNDTSVGRSLNRRVELMLK